MNAEPTYEVECEIESGETEADNELYISISHKDLAELLMYRQLWRQHRCPTLRNLDI
jgi:hypothetical protein